MSFLCIDERDDHETMKHQHSSWDVLEEDEKVEEEEKSQPREDNLNCNISIKI